MQNEEVSVKYMQLWEEMIYERQEARAEGLAEGRAEGRAEGNEEGMVRYAALTELLLDEGNMDALKRITKDVAYRDELLKKYNLQNV